MYCAAKTETSVKHWALERMCVKNMFVDKFRDFLPRRIKYTCYPYILKYMILATFNKKTVQKKNLCMMSKMSGKRLFCKFVLYESKSKSN